MSKKRFILFALVAALVLSFASSAFAADEKNTWNGTITTGDIGYASNYIGGDGPAGNNLTDMISIGGNNTTISVPADFSVGAVHVNAAGTVTFDIAANVTLTIGGNNSLATAGGGNFYGINAISGNIVFTGDGEVAFANATTAAPYRIYAAEGSTVTFKTAVNIPIVGTSNVNALHKHDKGTVAFESAEDNTFVGNRDFTVHDGVLAIGRPGHVPNTDIDLDGGAPDNGSPTLATTWTTPAGGMSFTTAAKITLATDATIDVKGTPLNLTTNAGVLAVDTNELTKAGPGAIVASITGAVAGTGSINVMAGGLTSAADNALAATLGVNVADGATFELDEGVAQDVTPLTASVGNVPQTDATLRLLEGSILSVNGNTRYPGYITGHGSLTVAAGTAVISGVRNDYTGDTRVDAPATIVLNHERNLGGYVGGKLRLEPDAIANAAYAAHPTIELPTDAGLLTAATLRIADGTTLILPNDIVIGDASAEYNTGGVAVDVPFDSTLYIANVIDYNRNYIVKTRLGEIVLDNMGFNSHDGGSAAWGLDAGTISTAWVVMNGTLRINTYQAADYGDVIVGPGSGSAARPILSLRNSLVIPNSILFCDQSSFETELIPSNLDEGSSVRKAVEVGQVWAWPNNARVWNRVNFLDLEAGTVVKDKRFSLMKAVVFRDYAAQNVLPVYSDGQTMAPFTATFDDNILYFRATSNIDVPVIGHAANYNVAPLTSVDLTINVTTATSLVAASTTLTTDLPGGLTATTAGNTVRLRGSAPAQRVEGVDDVYDVRLLVSSLTQGDTYGYASVAEFTVTVTGNGDVPPPPPAGPAWTWTPRPAFNTALTELSGTVTLAVDGNPVGAAVPAEIQVYEGGTFVKSADVILPASGASESFAVEAAYKYGTTYTLRAVTNVAAYDGVASATTTVTSPAAPTPDRDSSGGGCDAGFGLFGLLAATGAVTLLRKKG